MNYKLAVGFVLFCFCTILSQVGNLLYFHVLCVSYTWLWNLCYFLGQAAIFHQLLPAR